MSHIVIRVYNFACDYPGCKVTNIEIVAHSLREARHTLRKIERWTTTSDGRDICPAHAPGGTS